MYAAPFSHMLWKEYRSLRMLWVGCAVGTLGLWGLLIGVTALTWERYQDQQQLMHAFWSLSLWLPAIYLLGCTVATFAGEKEERTADWLVNISVPFGSTVAAKVLWPVVSAGAMQLALFGVTALIREYYLKVNEGGALPGDEMIPHLPGLASFALLEALVWGLFWSLQLSRPMPAAVIAAACIVLVNMGTINTFGTPWESYFSPWSMLRTVLLAILFVADLALARRWLIGRGWEWSIPWDKFIAHRQVTVAAPAMEHATPWRRAWQRFRWLEWQTMRIFLGFTIAIACVATVPVLIWHRQDSFGLVWASLYLLPLFAGLVAWQGEQSRQQFRFLVNRGISPVGLWLNKFGVWLATMCGSAVLLLGVAGTAYAFVFVMMRRFPVGAIWENMTTTLSQNPEGWNGVVSALCSYLVLFVSSFTVALYFRRGIFAFGAGLILHIALFYWFIISYMLQFPAWLGIAPFAVWLIWCSARQLPRWSLERTGWRVNGIIFAEWTIFPLFYAAAVTSYWVYSVPAPQVDRLVGNFYQNRIPIAEGEWTQVRQLAIRLAEQREQITLKSQIHVMSDLPDPEWTTLENDIRTLRDTLLKPMGISESTQFFANSQRDGMMGIRPSLVCFLLMELAKRELAAGNTTDSLRSVRAAVRYGGVLYVDAPLGRQIEPHNTLHGQLVDWSEHPANTPEIVYRALSELEHQELRWWRTEPLTLESQYQESLKELKRTEQQLGAKKWIVRPWMARERRIAACEFSNQLRFLQTPPGMRSYAYIQTSAVPDKQNAAWNFRRTRTERIAWSNSTDYNLPVGLTTTVIHAMWDREARIRCTFACMAASAYRKAHGRLPRDLAAVIPQFASKEVLTDPWNGTLLQIQPEGLAGRMQDSNVVGDIPPGTPFIWSVGPDAMIINMRSQSDYRPNTNTRYLFYLRPDEEPVDALQPEGAKADPDVHLLREAGAGAGMRGLDHDAFGSGPPVSTKPLD